LWREGLVRLNISSEISDFNFILAQNHAPALSRQAQIAMVEWQ